MASEDTTASENKADLRFEMSRLNYLLIHGHIASNGPLVDPEVNTAKRQPPNSFLATYRKSVTLITHVPMPLWPLIVCIGQLKWPGG